MNLAEKLRDQIRCYVDGGIGLRDVRGWLADHAQEIADSGEPVVDELDGKVWILISEFDYGHRDEANVRDELRRLLLPVRVLREESAVPVSRTAAGVLQISARAPFTVPAPQLRTRTAPLPS